LLRQNLLPAGLVALAVLGIGTIYIRQIAPPGCKSEQAMDLVSAILRDQFHLEGVFVNDTETVSGWYLSDQHDCAAQVAQIKGSVEAAGLSWRAIKYRIMQQPSGPVATVELGDVVPLAARLPSLWKRFLAYL
jgi:hypothetical protein